MKRLSLHKHLEITLFVLVLCASTLTIPVSPLLSIRSQGQNNALEMSGWALQKPHDEESGDMYISAEYAQSFRSKDIAQALFGCYTTENCTTVSIKGSAIDDRTENDLLADWFYLSPTYLGTLYVKPRIQNVTTALHLSWLSDELAPGLYLSVKAPVTWTRWHLKSVFFTEDEGTVTTPAGTYLENAEDYFCSRNTEFTTTFTATRLTCARFGCQTCDKTEARSTTRLTDLQTNIGYNFHVNNPNYALSIFARLVIPAGTRPCGEWLFEPIAGNGHHWELGGGINGSALLWKNKDTTKHFGFYGDITLTHLFGARHNRVFDLNCKPLSRYMTAAHFVDGEVTEHAPLANLTSCAMNVSVGIQADMVALINYTSDYWSYDFGYNLWARSCEKFHCTSTKCSDCCGKCIIRKGQEDWGISTIGSTDTFSASTIVEKAEADDEPVFIKPEDIDYKGAATKGITHKLFANVDYCWLEHTIIPHVGLGGEVEIGNAISCCKPSQSCCKNSAVSQWGLWLKGGVSF